MSPTITSGRVPGLEQRVRAAVDRDQHRLEVPDVRPDDPQVALVPGPAGDDERVPVAKARPQRREVDRPPRGSDPPRAGSASCCPRTTRARRSRGSAARPARLELLGLERAARRRDTCRCERGSRRARSASSPSSTSSKSAASGASISRTPPRTSRSGPGFGNRPVCEDDDVHDDPHARLDQLLRRDAVEIGVVDDRDVVRSQPADEVLRPPVEPRRARVLDEGSQRGHRTVCRNSWPPSIRRISSCRRSSSSCSIRVCVGSPGIFSTLKCRSATLAICGRCVIVITCARSASRRKRLADRVRGLAADSRVDLVEDHRLATADGRDRKRDARELAAGSRLRDRRERQARGSGGSGTRPRPSPVAPGSRSASSARNSPSPRPIAVQLGLDRVRERPGRRSASLRQALRQRPARASRLARRAVAAASSGSAPSSSAASSSRASTARARSSA